MKKNNWKNKIAKQIVLSYIEFKKSSKKKWSFEKIGYSKNIPEGADINDYEKISIRDKKGNINTLYRQRKKFEDLDDTTNFSSSWNIFKSHLN